MSDTAQRDARACPDCGASNPSDELIKREYRCSKCKLEMAHLDVAANGVIRGVFGWLHSVDSTILDRYRIKSVLGKGGFGATYLVEDAKLNGKRRALKEVPELLFDEYETELLSRLNHPSIPDIIDRSVVNGMVYLVLEFGGSRTLGGERKQNGRIPLAQLLPWMRQLCEVLIYLHSQRPPIIHRDLKPDNILLDENGRIMLIDFGIAKESTPSSMTRTLGRAATSGFSPPEQAMGTGTDERSDIYALSATFYALLTGENSPAAHERVAGKELAPPSQLVPDIPPKLEQLLLRALQLNVNHRPQSMKEFRQALDDLDVTGAEVSSRNHASSERTVMLGQMPGKTAGVQPSVRLHSVNITTGQPSAPVAKEAVIKGPDYTKQIAGGAAVVAVIAIGMYFYLQAPELAPSAVLPGTPATAPPYVPASVPPIALPKANPIQGALPLSVNFDGAGSTDTDNKIATYEWNFGDGATGNGAQIQHTYTRDGQYRVMLTVTDEAGTRSSDFVLITVETVQSPAGSASKMLDKRPPPTIPVTPAQTAPPVATQPKKQVPSNNDWLDDINPIRRK